MMNKHFDFLGVDSWEGRLTKGWGCRTLGTPSRRGASDPPSSLLTDISVLIASSYMYYPPDTHCLVFDWNTLSI
jgi:hypothetical protein